MAPWWPANRVLPRPGHLSMVTPTRRQDGWHRDEVSKKPAPKAKGTDGRYKDGRYKHVTVRMREAAERGQLRRVADLIDAANPPREAAS